MSAATVAPPLADGSLTRRNIGRGLTAQALALGSQGLGALQLGLLWLIGTSRATDTYFLCFAAGQLVLNVWVLGVVYPQRLLTGERDWAGVAVRASAGSAVAAAAAIGYLAVMGYPTVQVISVGVPLVISAAAAGLVSSFAAALACQGRALPLAGLALPANAMAFLGLVATHGASSTVATATMSIGLAIGNLGYAAWLGTTVRHDGPNASPLVTQRARSTTGSPWLFLASLAGGASPLAFQAALASFPAGQLSQFAVAVRVGLVLTGVGLNAILPLLMSWRGVAMHALARITRTALLISLPAAATAAIVTGSVSMPAGVNPHVVTLMTAWALVCPVTTVATRLVVLTEDLRFFRWSAAANVMLTATAASLAIAFDSISIVALGFLAVEAAVTSLLLWRAGWRLAAVGTLVVSVTSAVLTVVPGGIAILIAGLVSAGMTWAMRRPTQVA